MAVNSKRRTIIQERRKESTESPFWLPYHMESYYRTKGTSRPLRASSRWHSVVTTADRPSEDTTDTARQRPHHRLRAGVRLLPPRLQPVKILLYCPSVYPEVTSDPPDAPCGGRNHAAGWFTFRWPICARSDSRVYDRGCGVKGHGVLLANEKCFPLVCVASGDMLQACPVG
jgi:hypothetical protein